jgi:peptidyl-prolyl cis-trans isomerase D
MGTMTKLRDNTGVILWILVVAFGVIWVLQDSGAFEVVGMGGVQNIATVNGDPITVDEYNAALNARIQQYQAQTGETMPPEMREMEGQRTLDALIEDRLLLREMDRLGIRVTDQELREMILGARPHPIISMYFGDGQGGVNRALIQSYIENPEGRQEWIQLEDFLRTERRREKLANLIGATVRVSDEEIREEHRRRNMTGEARFVALRYADIPDDSVQVTDRDLRRFYDQNRQDFHRPRTYSIQYVTVTKDPSAEDSLIVRRELERLRPQFQQAENDSLFVLRQGSERPYTSAFARADELDPEIAGAVFADLTPGRVTQPIITGSEAVMAKIQEVRPTAETAVRARHILFRAPEGDAAALADARRRANDALSRARAGENFATLARQLSEDGSAPQGGDLGWFGRGRMVDSFERAAFGAQVGQVVGPIETQFGVHLIQVEARADNEARVALLSQRIRPDAATLRRAQERLDDVRYFGEETGNFTAEAERLDLSPQQALLQEGQNFLPGVGQHPQVSTFLSGARAGAISQTIEFNNYFAVIHVAEIQREGVRPFDDVRAEIEPRVRQERKRDLQRDRMERALAQGGFEGLAQRLGTQERIAQDVRYGSASVAGLGREPRFAGTLFGLQQNQTSRVVTGENAAFVLQVTSINEPAELTAGTRDELREQLVAQRRQQVAQEWLATLREQADVRDFRSRFQQ